MKLHEAIKKAMKHQHVWFRPVKSGYDAIAYKISDNQVSKIYAGVPLEDGITNDIHELSGEWEVITPQQLFAEFDHAWTTTTIVTNEEDLVDPFYWCRRVLFNLFLINAFHKLAENKKPKEGRA